MITHWTIRRKMAVIEEHRSGMTEESIFEKYGITGPELREWMAKVERHGSGALRVSRETQYRRRDVRQFT